MYKRIDGEENEPIEGYSYRNKSGDLESVDVLGGLGCGTIAIKTEEYEAVRIYYEDIPKLILALQAALDAEMARRDSEFIKVAKTMAKEK